MSTTDLNEVLDVSSGLLFLEEALSPIFCKPKLIPLKSVTLEKIERMQRESIEKLKEIEAKNTEVQHKGTAEAQTTSTDNSADNTADVWIADTNEEKLEQRSSK